MNKHFYAFTIFLLAAISGLSNVQSRAESRGAFGLLPESTIARNEFLTTGKGGDFAVVTHFGTGRTLNEKANGGTRFGLVENEKCYEVRSASILEGTVWFMINNASPLSGIEGEVRVNIEAFHYSLGQTRDGKSRLIFKNNNYPQISSFQINPMIENASADNRVTFWASASDLIEIKIETPHETYGQFLNGRYFIVLNDRILRDGLIPTCEKRIIFSARSQ